MKLNDRLISIVVETLTIKKKAISVFINDFKIVSQHVFCNNMNFTFN